MGALATNALLFFIIVVLRYFFFAGIAFALCWRWRKAELFPRKILPEYPARAILISEIKWSMVTSGIFAVAGALLYHFWGETKFYTDISQYGWLYFFLSLPILMFLHDTYFYWVHRLMHTRFFYRRMHKVHHDSKDPSPWAAFSFHPLEALVEALIIPALAFLIPIHPIIFLTFLMIMTVSSVINHLGFELFPQWFIRVPFLRECITATHHHAHHAERKYNFGLYFIWWDRWMGTQDPSYAARFLGLTSKLRNVRNFTSRPA